MWTAHALEFPVNDYHSNRLYVGQAEHGGGGGGGGGGEQLHFPQPVVLPEQIPQPVTLPAPIPQPVAPPAEAPVCIDLTIDSPPPKKQRH